MGGGWVGGWVDGWMDGWMGGGWDWVLDLFLKVVRLVFETWTTGVLELGMFDSLKT